MKTAVLVFPGSNCDHDAYHALKHVMGVDAEFVWHAPQDENSHSVKLVRSRADNPETGGACKPCEGLSVAVPIDRTRTIKSTRVTGLEWSSAALELPRLTAQVRAIGARQGKA
jgi:hypothetical protein